MFSLAKLWVESVYKQVLFHETIDVEYISGDKVPLTSYASLRVQNLF